METGKTLKGSVDLVFDTLGGTTHIIEQMHRNIAATPWPLGQAPQGPAQGIAGSVYTAIRGVAGLAQHVTGSALGAATPLLDRTLAPGPYREAIISVLNGVCGDHLAGTDNPLALPMRLRVLLPGEAPMSDKAAPGQRFFDSGQRAVELYPRPQALADDQFNPGGRILLLLHGLCMNDREWTADGHNHAEALAAHGGYTPVYALYNSGLHVSTNGRELCGQVAGLVERWPVPVESVTVIGFSMGGLVARSALHIAEAENQDWLGKVDKCVYVGTPHHGAVMERGGFLLQKTMARSPYTAPLAALGRVRSAGITDLRHGNISDDDWQHHDEHEDNSDQRQPVPLADGIDHYAIAATLSRRSGEPLGRLLGDGLVHPSSATGRHRDPRFDLAFGKDRTRIFYDMGHLTMLSDGRVLDQLLQWLQHDTVDPGGRRESHDREKHY